MKNWQWFLVGLAGFLAVLGVVMGVRWALEEVARPYADRGLPVVAIDLGETSLAEFKEGNKETKYKNNVLVTWEGAESAEYLGVEIKGRGNSTWSQAKKPFQVKLAKGAGLLGLAKSKKWVFLANYLDASFLRTDAAFKLAEMLDENYVARGQFAEVYFDGEYEGLYYATPKIEINKGSVDLRAETGALMEMDNLHRSAAEPCYQTYSGHCLVLKDTVAKEPGAIEAATAEFLTSFDQMERAAKKGNYAGVAAVADVEDLAKYFLVNVMTNNPDAYTTSFCWYKDGGEDKLHAGPVWDFDLAMANREWAWTRNPDFYSPSELMPRKMEVFGEDGKGEDAKTARLFYWLIEMPEFQTEVKRVFQEYLAGRESELEITILQTRDLIREAVLADAEKWARADFEAATEELLAWLRARYEFMEETFGADETLTTPAVL